MLYGLAQRGDAPQVLRSLSVRGVPVLGILISSGFTLIVVFLNYFFPGDAFLYLISIATCAAVISWVTIVVTHLKFRRKMEREGKAIKFSAPFYPWINYICLVFLIGVVVMMAQIPGMQLAVPILPAWLLVLWIGYRSRRRKTE
jgi:APC family aromatic amino acid transporter